MIWALLTTVIPSIFLVIIVIPFILHLVNQDGHGKYGGLYSVGDRYDRIKYFLLLVLLKLRKYRDRQKTSKIFDVDEGKRYRSIEKPQALDAEDAIDSVYFFCTGNLKCNDTNELKPVDIILRMARRKDRVNEFWMLIKQNGVNLVHPNYPETSVGNCSRSGWNSLTGLSINCDRSNEKWTIAYHGWLKEDSIEGKPVRVDLKLCFRAFTNIVDSHKDGSDHLSAESISRERWNRRFFKGLKNFAEKNQTHYEQWGGYSGHLALNRETKYQIEHGKGYRDHSFGIRNWNQYQRYGAIFGHLQNGGCFSLGSVCCRTTLSHIRYGYYVTPFGDTRPITHHDFNLWETFLASPPRSKFHIVFYAGVEKFELEASLSTEVIFSLNKGKCIIFERFMEFQLNGIPGKGVNEFCASDAVPRYKEPNVVSIDILNNTPNINTDKFCLSLEMEECRNRNLSGGKGCQLADLKKLHGFFNEINVPPGFVLTTLAHKTYLEANSEITRSISHLTNSKRNLKDDQIESMCADIRSIMENGEIPQQIEHDILEQLKQHFGDHWNEERLSIRSSSADEDSSSTSSAGQMDTYLGIKGQERIMEMIKKCWASQFNYIAVSYRLRNGQELQGPMAIVIMAMVHSETSGVLFTVDPVSGDATTIVINATFGLGEALVSGKCEPDNFEVEKTMDGSLRITSRVAGSKQFRVDMNRDKDDLVEAENDSIQVLCLSDNQVLRLSEIGILIEQCYGHPCDIEWAEASGKIHILQARPVTNLNVESDQELIREFDSAVSCDEECLTTANIGEMMPMATTPLTLSVFGSAIDKSFQINCLKLGHLSSQLYPRRFLNSFSNHLFINIHCLAILANTGDLKTIFLALLGRVLEKPTEADIIRFVGKTSFTDRIRNVVQKIKNFSYGTRETRKWEKKFQCGYKVQIKSTSVLQMKAILYQMEDYYQCWYDTIQNTSLSPMWSMILMKVMEDKTGWNNHLYSKMATLLSTCSDVISADVPSSLKKIAITIGSDEALKQFLLAENDESCLEWFNGSKSQSAGELFQEFLHRHGHRCIREAEFQESSWRTSPEKLVPVIRSMVKHLTEDDYVVKRELSIDEAIDSLHFNFNFFKMKIMRFLLGKTRKAVSLREWGKSISIEMCEAFKLAFNRLGELMVQENIISDRELVHFFTLDELTSVIVEKDVQISNVLSRVLRRKKIFEKQMNISMPEVCFGNPYDMLQEEKNAQIHEDGKIKYSGMPASVGRVSGRCRVTSSIEEASEILPGEILVAPYTDVGWTPYFPLLGGLVIEKGGLLSHGAVVAREYGLPCIVGCVGAMKIFKTGDHVLLNATEGIIEICTL